MNYIKAFFLLLLLSCAAEKGFVNAKLEYTKGSNGKEKFTISVPKGYSLKKYFAGSESGETSEFYYNDSSVIYVTDFESGLNEENIKRNSAFSQKKFEYKMSTKTRNDTVYFEGATNKNLFWKEVLIGNITLGYTNVSKEKKEIYDQSLKSFRNN